MITINLLPHHLRPIKRTPIPHLASLLALVLAIGAMGWLFLGIFNEVSRTRAEAERTRTELASLKPVVEEFNSISDKKVALQGKINIIQDILSDRVIWSEQLHNLARLTPPNIWYSRIRVIWQNFREQVVETDDKGQPVKDARTNQPKQVVKNVRRSVLEVSGYVINDENGEAKINPLIDNTEKDPAFSSKFKIYSPRTEWTDYNGFAIRKFTLEYLIQTGGAS